MLRQTTLDRRDDNAYISRVKDSARLEYLCANVYPFFQRAPVSGPSGDPDLDRMSNDELREELQRLSEKRTDRVATEKANKLQRDRVMAGELKKKDQSEWDLKLIKEIIRDDQALAEIAGSKDLYVEKRFSERLLQGRDDNQSKVIKLEQELKIEQDKCKAFQDQALGRNSFEESLVDVKRQLSISEEIASTLRHNKGKLEDKLVREREKISERNRAFKDIEPEYKNKVEDLKAEANATASTLSETSKTKDDAIKRLESRANELQGEIQQIGSQKIELSIQSQHLRRERDETRKEYNSLSHEHKALRDTHTGCRTEQNDSAAENRRLVEELADLDASHEELLEQHSRQKDENRNIFSKVESLDDVISSFDQERARLQETLFTRSAVISETAERAGSQAKEISRLKDDLGRRSSERDNYERELEDCQTRLDASTGLCADLETSLNDMKLDVEEGRQGLGVEMSSLRHAHRQLLADTRQAKESFLSVQETVQRAFKDKDEAYERLQGAPCRKDADLDIAQTKLNDAEQSRSTLMQDLAQKAKEIGLLEDQLQLSEQQAATTKLEVGKACEENSRLRSKEKELEKEKQILQRQVLDLESEITANSTEHDSRRLTYGNSMLELENEKTILKENVQRLESESQILHRANTNFQTRERDTNKIFEERQNALEHQVFDLSEESRNLQRSKDSLEHQVFDLQQAKDRQTQEYDL